jgi:transcriptional regulator with XRE-family HTH domain
MGEFGNHLRIQRVLTNQSLRAVAKKVGISHVFLGEVERGIKIRVGYSKFKKLAKALDITEELLEKWDESNYCPCCDQQLPANR